MSKPTIYSIETAHYSVTLDVLVSLAQALKISLAELVSFGLPELWMGVEPSRWERHDVKVGRARLV
jgi:hypothetical protein